MYAQGIEGFRLSYLLFKILVEGSCFLYPFFFLFSFISGEPNVLTKK